MIASLLTTWVTFAPCFLFIFLGAPHVERLRGNKPLSAALTGITAAAMVMIFKLRWSILRTLGVCAAARPAPRNPELTERALVYEEPHVRIEMASV
ncbi:chromate transporter [Arthrobacter monumenti]